MSVEQLTYDAETSLGITAASSHYFQPKSPSSLILNNGGCQLQHQSDSKTSCNAYHPCKDLKSNCCCSYCSNQENPNSIAATYYHRPTTASMNFSVVERPPAPPHHDENEHQWQHGDHEAAGIPKTTVTAPSPSPPLVLKQPEDDEEQSTFPPPPPFSPPPPPSFSPPQPPPASAADSSYVQSQPDHTAPRHSQSQSHLQPHTSQQQPPRRSMSLDARRGSRSSEGAALATETLSRTETIRQRLSRRRRKDDDDDDKVVVGTKVDQNHVNWVTAYNMLTGIRFTVSRIHAKMDRDLTDSDFDAAYKTSFDITGRELTPSAKYDFKFKDYAPWVFRHLRAKFHLDPADYLMSLTSKYILSELGSPGKSGSFFYYSRDYKYIIKTIHHAEHKLLRHILRDYYRHIENNPNTLISQFYGLHRVKMAYGRKIHFVVMNNLFPPHRDIHQMFDLKGSTVGRDYREEDLVHNPRATMKDLNWLRRGRHLHCGPFRKEVFMEQLRRDVALLQRLNIMDYSLLVGVHDLDRGNEEKARERTVSVVEPGNAEPASEGSNQVESSTTQRPVGNRTQNARHFRQMVKRERTTPLARISSQTPEQILDEDSNVVFYSDDGGFRATNEAGEYGDEIFYIGIIDCLTTYGVVKRAENFWKGLSHNKFEISPVPPISYASRFVEFIEKITTSPEKEERDQQERERLRQEARENGTDQADAGDPNFGQRPTSRSSASGVRDNEKKLPNHPRGHILSTINDPNVSDSSDGAVLPVVEEVNENSNSIRSQHASSMDIYETLMKGTSSRYEMRLSSEPRDPPPREMAREPSRSTMNSSTSDALEQSENRRDS